MARTPNTAQTVTITLSTTPQVRRYLEALLKDGLHGKNVAEAAERLLTEKILELRGKEALSRALQGVTEDEPANEDHP